MMFNKVVVQNETVDVLNDLKIDYECYDNNYYVVDAIELASGLIYNAEMSVATIYGLPRIDPIFRGMLLSGKKHRRRKT